ncbi:MAG: transcriptional regulator [Haloquadratum walsbyi J07HQW2]|uniref:Transcriptional regulator n=1 Tax=Haloquadratum walsbyi J07HQW2 TaxID=1238425 RepID=U1PX43_9EURY|nr:MAG: transcriptional regulator [Haloquadratum walsbyi J07HQW2]
MYDDKERLPSLRSVATPSTGTEDTVLGSASIVGPTSRVNDQRFYERFPTELREVAKAVNCSGVKPRSFFPWIGRTHPTHHRSGGLERCGGSRSGRPQAPMPAVATPISAPAGVC